MDEKVLKPALVRPVIHDYGEPLEAKVQTYALEEIVAEKLRAILQHVGKLEQRGWSRSRARDYYDLWSVLRTYQDQMDLSDFPAFLQQKCAVRDVVFTGPDDFFPERILAYTEETWIRWLGPLARNSAARRATSVLLPLPPFPQTQTFIGGPHVVSQA